MNVPANSNSDPKADVEMKNKTAVAMVRVSLFCFVLVTFLQDDMIESEC